MTVHVLTDSVSDIPAQMLESLPITVIPIHVMLNGHNYLDRVNLPRETFYKALPDADPHPTTATPSPGEFLNAYDQAVDNGASALFSIHVASTFSAVFQAARLAAEQYTRVPVYAIDSGNLTLAEGLVVIRAAQAASEGKSVEAIRAIIANTIKKTHAFAKLDSIDYLRRSGRMTSIQHTVIGLLGIKPILKMNDSKSKMEIARTRRRAFERVVSTAVKVWPQAAMFGISHANAPEQAHTLVEQLRELYPDMPEAMISEVTPALGVHVGPGALCVNWIEA